MHGDIYVEGDRVYSNIAMCPGLKIGYFLPTAKVKNNIKAMRPLVLHKIEGYLRRDTKEILVLNKNQEYHYSAFLELRDKQDKCNCFLDNDSSILVTDFVMPKQELVCFKAGWEKIDKTSLPQYAQHCDLQRKYAFKRNVREDFVGDFHPTPKQKKRKKTPTQSTHSHVVTHTHPPQKEEKEEEEKEEEKKEECEELALPKDSDCITQESLFEMFNAFFNEQE